jgi:ribokinase
LAGVSIGTVSNVLTSRRGVRPETRAKIDAAIRELGFVPDLAARSLIARRGRARSRPDPAAPRLTCVGYVCADYTARVAVLPHRDDRATALDIAKTLGGCAANVAVTAAGLGPPFPVAVDVLSVLGDDPDSDWATASLAERQVELVVGSRRAGARLSRCIILVEAHGARTIINEPLQVPPVDLERWLAEEAVARRHVLHLQGDQIGPLVGLLPRARDRGLLLATHTTHLGQEWRSPTALARLCVLFDVVILNREVARDSTGARGGTAELVRDLQPFVDAAKDDFLLILTLGQRAPSCCARRCLRCTTRRRPPIRSTRPVPATHSRAAFWPPGPAASSRPSRCASRSTVPAVPSKSRERRSTACAPETCSRSACRPPPTEGSFERFKQSR